MNPIAHSYWRLIKQGKRTYSSVPASVKEDVKALARLDAEKSLITHEQYAALIGEAYA